MRKQSNLSQVAASEAAVEATIHTVAPEWLELSEKLEQLLARERELLDKIHAQKKVIDPSGLATFAQDNVFAISAAKDAADKPRRMIGPSKKAADHLGKFAPSPVPAPDVLYHEPKISREFRENAEELAGVREAIALLHPQLKRAHLEGSARLAERLMPEYRAIARRIGAALVELGQAELAQREFMHRHRNAARSMFKPVHGTGSLGDPLDPHSELRRLLAWAVECGHFTLDDIPTEWRGSPDIRSWPESFLHV